MVHTVTSALRSKHKDQDYGANLIMNSWQAWVIEQDSGVLVCLFLKEGVL